MATASKVELFKFPRTRHLFDAGGSGVSRDDLLMDPGEEKAFYSAARTSKKGKSASKKAGAGNGNGTLVALEEKVDGANLGISLGDDMQFLVQNRSHFINSKTHRQFAPLDSWLLEHSPGIFQVLGEDPGNYVLFGEWLYAKHSIHYTRLPGYFMAFDVFDCKAGKFFSWRERNRRLEGSGIPVVRQIAETTLSGRDELLKLLDTESAFYDGPCEGIYLRIDEDMQQAATTAAAQQQSDARTGPAGGGGSDSSRPSYCVTRGKVVRPDFLQGIEEQWTRQQLTKNIVVHQY